MKPQVATEERAGVLVLRIDNPPVNALSRSVADAVGAALQAGAANAPQAIVIGSAGRTFVAGADISEIERAARGNPETAIDLHPLLDLIEQSDAPVVMALHGVALGGGLELAMAGHYRVAHADARLGQPEVNLGVIPGAGGTQRLPRLVGIRRALEMCISGESISAGEAFSAGLVDKVVAAETEIIEAAIDAARALASAGQPLRRTSQIALPPFEWGMHAPTFEAARALAGHTRPGETAPVRVIAAIESAATLPWAAGIGRERDLFLDCLADDQARAMIHLFFAERAAAKGSSQREARDESIGQRLMNRCVEECRSLVEAGTAPTAIARALSEFGIDLSLFGAGSSLEATPVLTARPAGTDEEIVQRIVYALVNEGARTLDEGVVARASDLDVMCVRRHGFPRWRGGPMHHADREGLGFVLSRLRAFHQRWGDRWKPAPIVERLASAGRTFRDNDRLSPQ